MREIVEETFAAAGVRINGSRPWDIQVHNEDFYPRVIAELSMGLGESYMDGWWDCERIDLAFERIYRQDLQTRKVTWAKRLHYLQARLYNMQRRSRAFQVGEKHYDAGNDLYRIMLGERMVYSSGYYGRGATTLEEAEEHKLQLICEKLGLQAGDRILDVGCGWGAFAKYAVENHGVEVVGITVSKEQIALASQLCAGLPIEFRLQDYREIEGSFDHVVSIGMVGHVGYRNYRTLMEVVHRALKDEGLFLIHTMGANRSTTAADPWIHKYIFPNGMAPSIQQLGAAIEELFVMEDWHNFSTDYHRTAMSWVDNLQQHWDEIKSRYDERFYRMWKYYLVCFAAAFAARTLQTWDIVLSKQGARPQYTAVR
jgi:cyclopropane-fatty-acyl-phospholipid synthase